MITIQQAMLKPKSRYNQSRVEKLNQIRLTNDSRAERIKNSQRISITEAGTYLSCSRKYHLKYRLGLYSNIKDYNLLVGILVDEWMNKYYDPKWWRDEYLLFPPDTGEKKEEADKYMDEWVQLYSAKNKLNDEQLIDLDKAHEKAQEMVNRYTIENPHDQNNICLATQLMVCSRVPNERGDDTDASSLYFYGIVDRVMLTPENNIILVDAKTTKQIDNNFIQSTLIKPQLVMYQWALKRMGVPTDAVMIDAISRNIKTPIKPPLTKDKTRIQKIISSNGTKRYDTTYKLLLETINENGFHIESYADELRVLLRMEKESDGNTIQFTHKYDNEYMNSTAMNFGRLARTLRKKDIWCLPTPNQVNCSMCDFKNKCHQPDQQIINTWKENNGS